MAAPKTTQGQLPALPDISEKDPRALAIWKDLGPYLESVHDDYIVEGTGITIDRLPGGGRSISVGSGRGGFNNQFGCSPSIDGSGNIVLQYGVVNGAGLSSAAPEYSSTEISGPTSVAVATSGVVGLYFEFEPTTQIVNYDIVVDAGGDSITSTAVYGFGNGGTIVGVPEIRTYTNVAAKDAARVTAVVDDSDGTVTTNLKEIIVLAQYASDALILPQSQVGPIGISVCGGALSWTGPAYYG